jgi:SAM-dependent methyltransferase
MNFIKRLFFKFWYFRRPPWDTDITPPEVYQFIEDNPPGKALDLGCGTGTNAITLAKSGWHVIGVDFVPRAIHIGRRKSRRMGVSVDLRVGDVTKPTQWLKTDDAGNLPHFNLILDIGCFHSIAQSDRIKYAQNIELLLAPGGTFLIYLFFRDQYGSFGNGILESDLEFFSTNFDLIYRENGTERDIRSSAWLMYRKTVS